jgi:hypothetical protein
MADQWRPPRPDESGHVPVDGSNDYLSESPELLCSSIRATIEFDSRSEHCRRGSPKGSTARQHGDVDDDRSTVLGTVARIQARDEFAAHLAFPPSASRYGTAQGACRMTSSIPCAKLRGDGIDVGRDFEPGRGAKP